MPLTGAVLEGKKSYQLEAELQEVIHEVCRGNIHGAKTATICVALDVEEQEDGSWHILAANLTGAMFNHKPGLRLA